MYKKMKLTKKWEIAVSTFPLTAKKVSKVYKSGFRYFEADEDDTWALGVYRIRVMLYRHKEYLTSSQ